MKKPCLVLLPGLDGTGLLFAPLVEAFGLSVETIVVSYPCDRKLGYEELLPFVMEALPRDSPFALLGESFSGPLALMAAAERPAGLTGIVLSASFVRSPYPWLPAWAGHLGAYPLLRIAPDSALFSILLGNFSTPALRALLQRARAVVSAGILAHRIGCALQIDMTRELAECHVPILYLKARHDLVVPAHNAAAIRAANPAVRVRELPAPHTLLQAQPSLAAAELKAFVASVGST